MKNEILTWLLQGDVSIRYQTYRDLMNLDKPALRKKIESEGWGKKILSCCHHGAYWGRGFYQPKWISSHYTLLDLKNLNIYPENQTIQNALHLIFENEKGADGGILPAGDGRNSDVCVSGMALNYGAYFHVEEQKLKSIVDFLLSEKMNDGGFNCQSNRKGAIHSSMHSTLSVLEGIHEYERNGYEYRVAELRKAKLQSEQFLLMHQLFRSDKTSEIINQNFLKLHYPCRWYYDILRAMDYFQSANMPYDKRMDEAIAVIRSKRSPDGYWKQAAHYPGQVHFVMEKAGLPSRWNTLRAMRVLKHYNQDDE